MLFRFATVIFGVTIAALAIRLNYQPAITSSGLRGQTLDQLVQSSANLSALITDLRNAQIKMMEVLARAKQSGIELRTLIEESTHGFNYGAV